MHLKEKRGHAFERGLAAQEQHVVFGMLKIVSRHIQETSDDREIGFCHALQTVTFHEANRGVNDGFGCETMEIMFEAKDIASQVKRADLATTVRQELVAPNRAFNHLIDVVCRLCFSENLGAPSVFELGRTNLCVRQGAKLAKKARSFIWISTTIRKHRTPPNSLCERTCFENGEIYSESCEIDSV